MDKKILLATIVGGVTGFILGFLIYGMLLMSFFEANSNHYEGLMKNPPDIWGYAAGNLLWAWLYSYIFSRWANISTFGKGLSAAITIAIPVSLAFDLYMYAGMNLYKGVGIIFVDVIAGTVISTIMGGVVGAMLGMGNKKASA